MTLVFHQAALGDFALALPLLRALPGPVTLVTTWSRGRLAAALNPGLRTADIDQFEFTRLHAEGGPSRMSPAVAELFEQAQRIVDFVGRDGDAWSKNLRQRAPDAAYVALPTRPARGEPREPLGVTHRRILNDAGFPLAPLAGAAAALRPAPLRSAPLRPAAPTPRRAPLLLHPGSGGEAKCWPLRRWIQLAGRLTARGHDTRLIFGEAEAQRWTDAQRTSVEAVGGCGLATLEALVEAMVPAGLYLGHDAGPTHLAAQLGVATVALFGPTDPAVWAPVGAAVRVIAPPEPRDMDWLTVDAAESAVLAELPGATGPG